MSEFEIVKTAKRSEPVFAPPDKKWRIWTRIGDNFQQINTIFGKGETNQTFTWTIAV